jgi:hydrogenase nickel incorporation protein HypA/HybF
VDRVRLDVGVLRQVVPDTLVLSWQVTVDGKALAGSVLDMHEIPAVLACHECGTSSTTTTTITVPVFRCPCASTSTSVVSGQELLVTSLELCPV